MFGLGFNKLVVLVVLIVAVWYAFKYVGRVEQVRQTMKRARGAAQRAQTRSRGEARLQAEDMVKCRACDAYVAATGAAKCGRSDCPW